MICGREHSRHTRNGQNLGLRDIPEQQNNKKEQIIMEELKYEELLPNFQELQNGEKTDGITFASFQKRAQNAVQELVYTSRPNPIMLLNTAGCNQEKCVKDLLLACEHPDRQLNDIIYAENLNNELAPTWLHILSGTAEEFNKQIIELLNKINHKVNAEEDFLQIMKKQPGNKKLETYLSDLSIFMAKGGEFTYPVLMNLMVCHDEGKAPVIYARDLTWKKLFGGVNYLTENGTTYSHHHLLEAGLLRKADGGFLIIPAEELIHNPILWFKLKSSLDSGLLDWENPAEMATNVVPFFNPEPTPINVKVIIVGSYFEIAELHSIDPLCAKSFYLRTDISTFFSVKEHGKDYLSFIKSLSAYNGFLPVNDEAALRLLKFSCREAESQKDFVLDETTLTNVICEASGLAGRKGLREISKEIIEETLEHRNFRSNQSEESSSDFVKDKQMLLQTAGEVIGQINGLSVISTYAEDFEYGEPTRITATIHSGGDGDISDIEHKADLAGQIHTKAMMIINGYLTNTFGREEAIPVSANLVFEQSYSEIDGDSASLTGLCAILSALSHKPIRQNLSLTGSLDQLGNVQPVGGLNEKIEGFYRVCKIQGISGIQGVIIPDSNRQSLVLKDEVVEAVRNGTFHIYPVKTVDEAIELLTGVKAGLIEGRRQADGEQKDICGNSAENETATEEPDTLYNIIREYLDSLGENETKVRKRSFLARIFGR